MRKAAISSFFVLASVILPVQAQETAVERLEAIFASRVPHPITITENPDASDPARIVVETPTKAVGTDDCAPVDPDRVRQLIYSISAEEGLDPELGAAVAGVESGSGANPGLSSAGAAGVMQLMPGTASDLGVADRCNTTANIRGGIRYLKQLLGEFGDPILALSAYNAGPGNVYKASGIPLNDETVKYIAKVLNRWKYARMLPPSKRSNMAATNTRSNEATDEESENTWRDGHVIDFN